MKIQPSVPVDRQALLTSFDQDSHLTLNHCLERLADETTLGVTVISSSHHLTERFYSYQTLYLNALTALGYLQNNGVKAKDEVVIQTDELYPFLLLFWACLLGGMVAVPLSNALGGETRAKLRRVLKQLNNPTIVGMHSDLTALNGICPSEVKILDCDAVMAWRKTGKYIDAHRDDLAFVQFSSGSTGEPKGVQLSHRNLMANIVAIGRQSALGSHEKLLSWMPLTHDMGLIGFHLVPLVWGLKQYLMPTRCFVRNPLFWLDKVSEHKITITASPNFGYRYFLKFYHKKIDRVWDLSNLKLIFNGAEPIVAELARQFVTTLKPHGINDHVIFPVYGLAEASLAVTFPPPNQPLTCIEVSPKKAPHTAGLRSAGRFVQLGQPIDFSQIRIRDDDNQPVDEGNIGEIQISGINVTCGYYNQPKLNDTTFTKDGWLKTGDLGLIHQGTLVVAGRKKDIIFHHSQNYFSHDLERIIASSEVISDEQVVVCSIESDGLNNDEVVAFVRHRGSLEAFARLSMAIASHFAMQLGWELSHILPVRAIAKTTSGKVKRFTLKQSYLDGEFNQTKQQLQSLIVELKRSKTLIKPRLPHQKQLMTLWKKILKQPQLSMDDNFFESGGDSLSAMRLLQEVNNHFQCELSLWDIFEHPTLAQMSDKLQVVKKVPHQVLPVKQPIGSQFPLTREQERLYFLQAFDKTSVAYNNSYTLKWTGPLDLPRLEAALNQVIDRHQSLRTRFVHQQDLPCQIIEPCCTAKITRFNAGTTSASSLIQPFDLSQLPLFHVYCLDSTDHSVLLFDFHHIITDGLSISTLFDELFNLYNGQTLPPVTYQYGAYAHWQASLLAADKIKNSAAYWQAKLDDLEPLLNLPTDRPRPAKRSEKGARVYFELEKPLTRTVKQLCSQSHVTPNMVLLTTFIILLHKYAEKDDIWLGTMLAGRNRLEFSQTIGMFVKTLVIREHISDEDTFISLVRRTKQLLCELYEHQDYPFQNMVQDHVSERSSTHNPLFNVAFIYQNFALPEFKVDQAEVEPIPFDNQTSKLDLSLEIFEVKQKMLCSIEYACELYDVGSIERLIDCYKTLLGALGHASHKPIAELDMLPAQDKLRIQSQFNHTVEDFGGPQTVMQLFEQSCAKFADAIAVSDADGQLSYRQLAQKVETTAIYLHQQGIKAQQVVGVSVHRSIDLVISILALFRLRAVYMPIDLSFPPARLERMLHAANAVAVLYQQKQTDQALGDLPAIYLAQSELPADDAPVYQAEPEDIAYIIFTSGSTGKPKGVQVRQRNLSNFMAAEQTTTPITPQTVMMAKHARIFDFSICELFAWMIAGAQVYLLKEGLEKDPDALLSVMHNKRIDFIGFTPSALRTFMEFVGDEAFAQLDFCHTWLLAAEPLPMNLVRHLKKLLPNSRIYNGYGPTETTVGAIQGEVDCTAVMDPSVGKPFANVQIHILDQHRHIRPIGVPGEIYISGAGVSKGYLDDRLNQGVFSEDPFITGHTMYKSGDRGQWLETGEIRCIGRIDNQVKLRGFRIELDEIAAIMGRHPGISQAVAIKTTLPSGEDGICGYYIADKALDSQQLRDKLASELPEYMVPSYLIPLDALPMTVNEKLDTSRLPRPEPDIFSEQTHLPFDTKTEHTIGALWCEVLGLKQLGKLSHFFKIGGQSLLALRLINKIKQTLSLELEVSELFDHPVLQDFCARIDVITEQASQKYTELKVLLAQTGANIVTDTIALGQRQFNLWYSKTPLSSLDEKLLLQCPAQDVVHYLLDNNSQTLHLEQLDQFDQSQLDKVYQALQRQSSTLNKQLQQSQKILRYPCGNHPSWFVRRGFRSIFTAQFKGSRAVGLPAVIAQINGFIACQSLLRSNLINEGEEYYFEEYQSALLEPLVSVDISGYHPDCHVRLLTELEQLLAQQVEALEPLNNLLYNFLYVKLNASEYRLLCSLDHIIADHDTARVVTQYFEPLNHYFQANNSYDNHAHYQDFARLAAGVDQARKLALLKNNANYQQYAALVGELQQQYGIGQSIVHSNPYHLEIDLSKQQSKADETLDFLGYGLYFTCLVGTSTFDLKQQPLRVLVNRRLLEQFNFYRTVGDFHDSVPITFTAEQLSMEYCAAALEDSQAEYAELGLFTALGHDQQVYHSMFKSPFNFNYIGGVSEAKRDEMVKTAAVFPFVSYPTMGYQLGNTLGLIFFHGMKPQTVDTLKHRLTEEAYDFQLTRLATPDESTG